MPPPPPPESHLGHFFYLRKMTQKSSKMGRTFQLVLWVSTVLRFVWTWYAYSPEKAVTSAAFTVSLAVFHLMYLKMNAGPVEVEPLLLELLSARPVPKLDPAKVPKVPASMLKVDVATYNEKYGVEIQQKEFADMIAVWKGRVESYSHAMWSDGKPQLAWYNNKARQTFRTMPFVVAFSAVVTLAPIQQRLATNAAIPIVAALAGWGYGLLEVALNLGLWLFVIAITLEILLVVHLEGTQLRRHMARVLVGELKTVEEIHEDHLRVRMGTLASWSHYQLPMLYAALVSFGVILVCSFYLYTEGFIADGWLPSPYLIPLLGVGSAWASIIGAVAGMNMISEFLVMYIPTVHELPFAEKQELVRYYQGNKAHWLLLPMGILVTPLMFLGWLLSLTSMGVISLLNFVYATAQARVAS